MISLFLTDFSGKICIATLLDLLRHWIECTKHSAARIFHVLLVLGYFSIFVLDVVLRLGRGGDGLVHRIVMNFVMAAHYG